MSPARGTNRAVVTVGVVVLLVAVVGFAVHAAHRASDDASALTGRRWTLTRIVTSGHAAAPSRAFGVASISFDGDGGFVGNDGCNDMVGKVRIDHRTLEFGRVFTTVGGCISSAANPPDPATDPIAAMDRLAVGPHPSATWQITNGHLRLTGPTGDPVLEFTVVAHDAAGHALARSVPSR